MLHLPWHTWMGTSSKRHSKGIIAPDGICVVVPQVIVGGEHDTEHIFANFIVQYILDANLERFPPCPWLENGHHHCHSCCGLKCLCSCNQHGGRVDSLIVFVLGCCKFVGCKLLLFHGIVFYTLTRPTTNHHNQFVQHHTTHNTPILINLVQII